MLKRIEKYVVENKHNVIKRNKNTALDRSGGCAFVDASGFSGSLIDNLSVTQLSPAASTQPFGYGRS
jgi:hypothetical protein